MFVKVKVQFLEEYQKKLLGNPMVKCIKPSLEIFSEGFVYYFDKIPGQWRSFFGKKCTKLQEEFLTETPEEFFEQSLKKMSKINFGRFFGGTHDELPGAFLEEY